MTTGQSTLTNHRGVSLGHGHFDVHFQACWVHYWGSPGNHLSILADQESFPVPRDVTGFDRRVEQDGRDEGPSRGGTLTLEVGVERMLILSVHFDLFKQLEVGHETISWSDVLDPVQYLCAVRPRLLQFEYITGEAQYDEVIAAVETILSIECIHAIVMVGQTSIGRHVHDQDYLSFVVAEVDEFLLMDVHQGEIMDGSVHTVWLVTFHHGLGVCYNHQTPQNGQEAAHSISAHGVWAVDQ